MIHKPGFILAALAAGVAGIRMHALPRQESRPTQATAGLVRERIQKEAASLAELYRALHQAPELSYHEASTAARIRGELESAGFEVFKNVGKYINPSLTCHGVVGVLKNGEGPVVYLRTDMDGLPVREKTGLAYASQVTTKNDQGESVGTMHACGHDMHMTAFVGAARALAALRDRWQGTIVMIGQPAEERAPGGAEAMLRDSLYKRFGTPVAAFALHCNATLETGRIGYVPGYALANADTVDITVRGVGGHGAYPQACKDPVVLASQMILAFQTLVSRELAPGDPGVITVGSIHGGTKHNIIPAEVTLQITVRSYSDKARETLLQGIRRIAKGTAEAAGVPEDRMPVVELNPTLLVPATFNNPELTRSVVPHLQQYFGEERIAEMPPVLGAEDFGHFSLPDRSVPCSMFWLGTVAKESIRDTTENKRTLPSLHSDLYAPVIHPTIETGAAALTIAALSKLNAR